MENSAKILVVDDEEVIRYTLQKKLSRLGFNITTAEKAEDVLYLLKSGEKYDLVISDVKLRKMDGIELLRRINGLDEPVPVLIISAYGNVEDVIKSLRYGASDFIRKPFDINDVASSVRTILKRKQEKRITEGFARFLDSANCSYTLPIDTGIINSMAYLLTRDLVATGICNTTTAENIALALQEALNNAMIHGCLEVSSDIREDAGLKEYNEIIETRKTDPRYSSRRVRVSYELTREYVEYTIEDEGNGFDYRSLPDPRDPDNFFKNSGRGMLIIKIHMDEINWNEKGSRIRLRKNRVESRNDKNDLTN
jgi:DNA-binding response OmpR family regulator